MIHTRPAGDFEAILEGAPSDLVGTIGIRIIDPPSGDVVVPRSIAGVAESPEGSGVYSKEMSSPSTPGVYLIVWDTGGTLTPLNTFTEQLVVGPLEVRSFPSSDYLSTVLHAHPGSTFEAILEGAATGLEGTIGVQIVDPSSDDVLVPRTEDAIVESPVGAGVYCRELLAPNTPGLYLIIWDTGGVLTPQNTYTEQLLVGPTPSLPESEYLPTVDQVGAILRAYTQSSEESAGAEVGTFNLHTSPTAEQVECFITIAWHDVRIRVGADGLETTALNGAARNLVAIRSAMYVSMSKAPEQIGEDESIYDKLKELFDENMEALLSVIDGAAEEEADEEAATSLSPVSSYPDDEGGMVGWGTNW